jgi:hypothetical protein
MQRLIQGFVALGLVAACAAAPATAQNLLANPGFETGGGSYAGWFTFGSGVQMSTAATDNIFRSGGAASKTFGGFAGCPNFPSFSVGGFGQAFAAPAAGQVYTLSGHSYIASADSIPGTATCSGNRMLAKIVFFNAASGGAELSSNEIVIGDFDTVKDQWLPFTVSAPVPAGAQRVEALFLYLQPACAPGSVFLDDVEFTATAAPVLANQLTNPSFSSGLTGWSSFGNALSETRPFAVRTPSGSVKMFSTFVPGSPSGIYQGRPATPGENWRLALHTLTTCVESPIAGANDNFGLARIVFRDGADVEIGGVDAVVRDASSPLGTWTAHSLQAVAPAGTVTAQAYMLFISPTEQSGALWVDDFAFAPVPLVGVGDGPRAAGFELRGASPNPSFGRTRVEFTLAEDAAVTLRLVDISGRVVRTLHEGPLAAGAHAMVWDGRSDEGRALPAGVYQAVLRSDKGQSSRRLVLAR